MPPQLPRPPSWPQGTPPGDPSAHRHTDPCFCLRPTAVPRQRPHQRLHQRLHRPPPAAARRELGERGAVWGEKGGPSSSPWRGSAVPLPKAGTWGHEETFALRPVQAYFPLVAVPKPPWHHRTPLGPNPALPGERDKGSSPDAPSQGVVAASAPLAPLNRTSRAKAKKAASGLCQVPAVPSSLPGRPAHSRPRSQGTLPAITFSTADNQLKALPTVDFSPAVKLK